jgi:solute carrier family 25 carnitine/acylcarnitine transporter 20/29
MSNNLSQSNSVLPMRQRAFAAAAPSGDKKGNALRDILSGTAGGIAQVGAGHPLDTLKVRLQTQVPGPDGKMPFAGMGDCIRKTIALEGYGGLYKGAASPLLGSMAHNAGVFFSYGQAKKIVGADPGAPLFKYYQAGALAAVFITCVESPVDLLKIKLQAQVGEGEYKGVLDAARKITKQHGIKGVYQGFVPTMVRNIPCFGFYFMGSEFGYRLVCPVGETHTAQQVFLGGMVSYV